MRFFLSVLAVLAFCSAASACDIEAAWACHITVSRAIVVAPPNANAPTIAAYFTIENHGAAADQLTGISTATAASAMLHENVDDNGVMKMLMLEKLDIPAGGKVVMAPAKLHVMLMGPKTAYKIGDDVKFELSFATAGKMQVKAKVMPLSAALGE
jgi:periplasmic copper chaperone A